MKKKTIITLIIITLLILIIYFLKDSFTRKDKNSDIKNPPLKPFTTTIVKKVITTGSITPKTEVDIKSQVPGIVENIFVGVGQKVSKGDALVKIKLVPDPESINNAESNIKIAQINFDESKKEYERQKQLFEAAVIAQSEYIKYEKDFKIRKEELKSAENRLQLLKEGVAKEMEQKSTLITATCDGIVLNISTKVGGSVMGRSSFNEGTTIMTIADMNELVFQGKIGESDVGKLKLGMEIELTIGAIENEKFKGILEFIAPKGKDEQGSIKFDFSASVIPKENIIIRAGYSANAVIILDKKENILAIKESYLQFKNDSAFVEIKTKDNKFEKRFLTLGISDGINIEVKSGVSLEDEIKNQDLEIGK